MGTGAGQIQDGAGHLQDGENTGQLERQKYSSTNPGTLLHYILVLVYVKCSFR